MTTPMWIRAVASREGDFLVTKCCIVADADVFPFEVRVDMRKLAATIAKLVASGKLKLPQGSGLGAQDRVAGFGSFLKKAARAVTKNKITKAVGKVVTKVVKSPVVQIANPMAAIAVHTSSKALGGRGVIKGPAGKIVDLGAAVAAPIGLGHVSAHVAPKAMAALGLGAKTVLSSKLGAATADLAKQAQAVMKTGMDAAAVAKKIAAVPESVLKSLPPAARAALLAKQKAALPLVKKAIVVRATVPKIAPALAKKVKLSKTVKKNLVSIAAKARAGDPDAKYTASVIARTAKMTDEIARAQQAAGGGNPGFVITATGKIRKAPKGKFLQQSSAPVIETLYRGATTTPLRGAFTAVSGAHGSRLDRIVKGAEASMAEALVMRRSFGPIINAATNALVDLQMSGGANKSQVDRAFDRIRSAANALAATRVSGMHETGPSWGGYDDPADQMEGPLYPVRYPEVSGSSRSPAPGFGLRAPSGQHGWKGAPGTTAAARDRTKALLELARARHHLNQVARRARVKVGSDMSHLDVPEEMTEASDGIPDAALHPEIIGCNLNGSIGADLMVGGLPWYVFTRRGLRQPVVRRRFLAGLKAMTPKARRRVIARVRGLHLRERISGAVVHATPNVGTSLQGYGWAGVHGERMDQIAGPLTP